MSGSINKCILIGAVGKDPEIRSTQGGQRIASFSLAMSEAWKDKNSGERRERTEWANIVVFNDGLVGVIEQYVKKGSKLYVEGALQTRKYTDRDGNDRTVTEIVLQQFRGQLVLLGDAKSAGHDTPEDRPARGGYHDRRTTEPRRVAPVDDLDDEIPI